MTNDKNYECFHEELIQDHTLKINELQSKSNYKTERLDKLEKKMDKMDRKLDGINSTLNEIKLQSTKDDTQLELRLTAIETEQETLKEQLNQKQDESNRLTSLETTVRVLKWGISVLLIIIPILVSLNILK